MMVNNIQETAEVQSCIRKYPWLIQMVKSKQFHTLCDKHPKPKPRCFFCCDCMVPPLCSVCYKNSDHKHHHEIQAYKSSNQSAVRKDIILKYMDISGIHIYMINRFHIVYINHRRDSENYRSRNNVLHKCQVCEWELDAASSDLFCSIECKFRNTLGSQLDDMMESSSSEISEISEDIEPVKKKRHRRKGTPHRSAS